MDYCRYMNYDINGLFYKWKCIRNLHLSFQFYRLILFLNEISNFL